MNDQRFLSLKGVQLWREEVRAMRPGRYFIVRIQPNTMAHALGMRFALAHEDERAAYEAGGAVIVDYDAPSTVTVVRATDAGLDPAFRWYCSCERHSTLLGVNTKRQAESASREPQDWCEECRNLVESKQNS